MFHCFFSASLMTVQAGFLHINSRRSRTKQLHRWYFCSQNQRCTTQLLLLSETKATIYLGTALQQLNIDNGLILVTSATAEVYQCLANLQFTLWILLLLLSLATTTLDSIQPFFCYGRWAKLLWLFHISSFFSVSGAPLFFILGKTS